MVRAERAERALEAPLEYDYHSKRSWAWRQVETLGRSAKKEEVRLAALREFIKRTDPEPKAGDELDRLKTELDAASKRTRAINIAIITGDVTVNGHGAGSHPPGEPQAHSRRARIISGEGGGA